LLDSPTSTSADPSAFPGLSTQEAAARLARDGYNELPSAKPRRVLALALDVVHEPMLLLTAARRVAFRHAAPG